MAHQNNSDLPLMFVYTAWVSWNIGYKSCRWANMDILEFTMLDLIPSAFAIHLFYLTYKYCRSEAN
jgi:hypothetical protein